MFDWMRRLLKKDKPEAGEQSYGVAIKWCRQNEPTKAQNHIGRCKATGKFCDPAKRTTLCSVAIRYYEDNTIR